MVSVTIPSREYRYENLRKNMYSRESLKIFQLNFKCKFYNIKFQTLSYAVTLFYGYFDKSKVGTEFSCRNLVLSFG